MVSLPVQAAAQNSQKQSAKCRIMSLMPLITKRQINIKTQLNEARRCGLFVMNETSSKSGGGTLRLNNKYEKL